jgi:hypothetical protein
VRGLESVYSRVHSASPAGNAVAAAIRELNAGQVRSLLNESPELLHAGDESSNQPIHWAVMTRQIDIIDELLARGADINARRADGACPIQLTNGDYSYRGWRDVPAQVTTTPAEVYRHLVARGHMSTSAWRMRRATSTVSGNCSIRIHHWPTA